MRVIKDTEVIFQDELNYYVLVTEVEIEGKRYAFKSRHSYDPREPHPSRIQAPLEFLVKHHRDAVMKLISKTLFQDNPK